ncbi:MAG: hypothetical protein HFJ40_05975 [Clostridia bacterium]|nr:hypothetical protein [Clostridia bacterium]
MIDWKKEYNKLYKTLIAVTILIAISLIMFIATFSKVTIKLKEKDNKITEQQIEILDLKEQIHREKIEEESYE